MDLKILFSGLSKAGKTSIIRTLDKDTVEFLRPTIDMEVTEMRFLGMDILRWDLGGQKVYRDKFIANFDRYIEGTHMIMYVLSVLDKSDEKESIQFLETVLTKLKGTDVHPHIGLLLHKLDPTIKNLPKVAKYTDKLEKKIRKLLASYDNKYLLFRTSIYDPASVMEAFALMLNSRFPKGEYVTKKIEEICEDIEAPMGMAHAVGGDKDYPFLFGRYIKSGSYVQEAVQFIKNTYYLAGDKEVPWTDNNVVLYPLSDDLEIVAKRFFVGNVTTIFATALPVDKYDHDPVFREYLDGNIDDLQKLLEAIAIGIGLKTSN